MCRCGERVNTVCIFFQSFLNRLQYDCAVYAALGTAHMLSNCISKRCGFAALAVLLWFLLRFMAMR